MATSRIFLASLIPFPTRAANWVPKTLETKRQYNWFEDLCGDDPRKLCSIFCGIVANHLFAWCPEESWDSSS